MRECRIIGIVGSYGEASFRRTCEDSNLGREQASQLVNRLIEEGLLARIVNVSDKRTFKVTLTVRGRAIHKELDAAATSLNKEWLSVLSRQQQEGFYNCLDLLTKRSRTMRRAPE